MLDKIVDLAILMYEEAPYRSVPISREDVKETLLGVQTAEEEGRGYLGVLYSNDTPVGFLAAMLVERHPIWGSNVKVAAELGWYVHPDYRKRGGAIALLEAFEKWTKSNNVEVVINAAMHNDSYEQVKKMYEARGYKAGETAFYKVV